MLCLVAVFPVETVGYHLAARVQIVHYDVRVARMAGSKYNDFEALRERLQKLCRKRTNVDSCFDLFARGKLNLELDVVGYRQ